MKFKIGFLTVTALFFGFFVYNTVAASDTNGTGYDNAALNQLAQSYNQDYFGGRLPANLYVHWDDIPVKNGETVQGRTYYRRNPIEILIDRKTNVTGEEAALTLLHEECHVQNKIDGTMPDDQTKQHGPAFQVCMKNLAPQGAFEGLW